MGKREGRLPAPRRARTARRRGEDVREDVPERDGGAVATYRSLARAVPSRRQCHRPGSVVHIAPAGRELSASPAQRETQTNKKRALFCAPAKSKSREKERKRTRHKEKERHREREKASHCTKRISAAKIGREVARARWKVADLDPRSSKSLASKWACSELRSP